MGAIQVRGGNPLFGETKIQGSKNAVLPIMAAALLMEGTSIIENCPKITDVFHMQNLLEEIGCKIHWRDRALHINAANVSENTMSGELVTGMRSSIMLLGAMLGRLGKAAMNHPGGCVIGERPIDIHLAALTQMGVKIQEEEGFFTASAEELTGNVIKLPIPSVGATENVLLAAVMAKGVTLLKNAAQEPEITALCDFLKEAGADIESDACGRNTLLIKGGQKLHPITFKIPTDRIVAGTYLLSVLGTGGHIFLEDAPVQHMKALIRLAEAMDAEVSVSEKGIAVLLNEGIQKRVPYLETGVYPFFPTDMQSPLLAVLTKAKGRSVICETIFENRFRIVPELQKMGAEIEIHTDRNLVRITGVNHLQGAKVAAQELRGGAALVIAGCMAEGETVVENRHFIERGYEDIVRDYRNLGVKINTA